MPKISVRTCQRGELVCGDLLDHFQQQGRRHDQEMKPNTVLAGSVVTSPPNTSTLERGRGGYWLSKPPRHIKALSAARRDTRRAVAIVYCDRDRKAGRVCRQSSSNLADGVLARTRSPPAQARSPTPAPRCDGMPCTLDVSSAV